ncbi:Sugar kinase of the NBD/HSP70 family, may contain an N-terminal HTH domain [Paracoccus aminovorans]|uniref:Sugar kinase of the NBD/HSP70 family, may contain an N-terminal HTH domain n=1 Tax=Paracoccus aminovorans TaxID=34004 RepID=A0A1I3CD72_9RHOB|nr:ROK family transcriptional regulator [Paracoccus aminovorans]CQR85301.1 ROK family transcriptional regulator [Paracoccus aminovorans]SFH72488.1 Sugar kinase of the NBD/HSP70 family, may contain an N-terminal HTH domain [Paracoccus aminovorans]
MSKPTPEAATPQGLRSQNERLILWLIRRGGPMPRAALAQATGLSAQAVTNITRELIAAGLLDAGGERRRGKVGQPVLPLGLAPEGALFLGLKVGRRVAELVLVDFAGTIRQLRALPHAFPEPDAIRDFAVAGAAAMLAELTAAQRSRLSGMGIASPFYLWDWGDEMAPWRGRDLRAELAQALDLPVWLENDGSCACGAEMMFGSGELPEDFLYFYLAHFAGGGVVLDGRLRLGPSRNAGAMGSYPVPGGRQVLDVASVSVLETALGRDLPLDDAGWRLPPDIARQWLDESARVLSHAALGAVAALDLPLVVIDGAMPAALRDALVQATAGALAGMRHHGVTLPEVRAGTLGRRARTLGAAALPLSAGFMPGGGIAVPRPGRNGHETQGAPMRSPRDR